MAPKKNPTQTTTVYNTETLKSQANIQVVIPQDQDILTQNLTNAFTERICSIVSANNVAPSSRYWPT